ncbi:MAG: zipA [Gammaproteobacteria bacterium]|nr:zipA [Gammaproteobacteria bacterium]
MQLSVIFALIVGLSIAIFAIELIRRRKLYFKRQPSKRQYRERNYNYSPSFEQPLDNSNDEIKIINETTQAEAIETKPQIIPAKQRKPLPDSQDIIIINIIAEPGKKFVGYDLLQGLLSAGMRFGKMNIFHRHEEANGKGKQLFSLASITKPGTFDIHKMGSVSCIGLSMFMRLSDHDEPLEVYDLMIKTATLLAEDLHGNLFEINHEPLTHDDIIMRQQWIHDYQYQLESVYN